jgi:small subunit ribosomal protein S1
MENREDSGDMKNPSKSSAPQVDEPQEETFKEEFIKDLSTFLEGEIVEGVVVAVAADSIFVDIGYKSEGDISLSEFSSKPETGEKIKVMLVRKESKDGRPILSKKKADEIVKWENIQNAFHEGSPLKGEIKEVIKGGYSVEIDGFNAFLPKSQASMKKISNPESLIGEKLLFQIDKLGGKNNVVVSHRKHMENKREKEIRVFFETKKEGDVVEGVVKDIVGYGAFMDLGCLDGLLHINDMSWGRVYDPKRHIKKGEKLSLRILSIDPENRKVSLGLKQMVDDPWKTFEERYQKGQKCEGSVTKLTNFGGFIQLEDGIEGLLHISELSWTKRINHPKEVLKVGDRVEIMILDYDLEKKTVSLGLKQVLPNPWDTIDAKYPVGSKAKAKINKITRSGMFVEIEEGIEGFLHVDEISWTKQSRNILDNFNASDSIEVVILSIDKENRKIQMSLKQLTTNPWESLKERHPVGSVISGEVSSITDFGVFVKVDKDIEGLIHVSQLSHEKIENPGDHCKVGDKVEAMVIDIDENKKKVSLSVKDLLNRLEKQEIQKYIADDIEKTDSVSLGDLIDLSQIGK